jgi:hypothetical protein
LASDELLAFAVSDVGNARGIGGKRRSDTNAVVRSGMDCPKVIDSRADKSSKGQESEDGVTHDVDI